MKAKACNFTKSNTAPSVFFTFFELYEWYQIAQSTTIIWFRNRPQISLLMLTEFSEF